jgi:phosphopantetheine binding protein
MKPRAMDSLDAIELVMAIEEGFEGGFGIRNAEVGTFNSPRELVDWLEVHLANQRPNKIAQALLRKLALDQN